MKTVAVNTPSKTYEVRICSGLLDRIGQLAAEMHSPGKAVLVTDTNVEKLYAKRAVSSLLGAGYEVVSYVFPAGEPSKNSATLFKLLNFMAESRLTRTDVVFALGGGVTGDMAGLAAALYMRGIGLVQVPTTLLAAVDSSVGGKTAIDLPAGKNLAGAFYQPDMVVCDTDTLSTLPEAEFANGCAEIIKYGMISDASLLDALSDLCPNNIEEIIGRCVEIKRDIVCADEREKNIRQILNFGHTFGHAIEALSNYTVSHGSAVAVGMVLITTACVKKSICDKACLKKLKDIISRCSLPTVAEYSEDEIFNAVLSDKKRASDILTLVVTGGAGNCRLLPLTLLETKEFLRLGLEGE